jgi:hypothetical protein
MHTIRTDGTIILPVGARPPTFPDEPVETDLDRELDRWTTSAADDDERACRGLRSVAIRNAAGHDDTLDRSQLERLFATAPIAAS